MAGLLFGTLLVVACTSTPSTSSTPPAASGATSSTTLSGTPTSTSTSANITEGSITATGALVILLTEQASTSSYYYPIWGPEYPTPLFALWPDGRMLVKTVGGYGVGPAIYQEAWLSSAEVDELRNRATAARLSTLASTYPVPGKVVGKGVHLPPWRLQVTNGGTTDTVTFWTDYQPVDDDTYPARLKAFIDQLMSYRTAIAKRFAPDEIEVVVRERPQAMRDTSALPAVFDLGHMEEISRTEQEVRHEAIFAGEKAATIRALLDSGRFLYNQAGRSYDIYYRPIVDWPLGPLHNLWD